jgi:gamma-glutamyltranspeptidase/glutathione hydrolase
VEILRRGGNAFDAAVATGFVEAVISPHNCGIGGYAATGIVFHAKSEKPIAIDANAVAPRDATPGMFPVLPARDPNDFRLPDDKHKRGPLSIAVPGVLDGLLLLLETGGTLDRKTVMAPAIRLAREGVVLPAERAFAWRKMQAESEGKPVPARENVPVLVPMPELADTLQAISEEGRSVFYTARIGQAIADHVRRQGGILSRDDMAAYRALAIEPVSIPLRGHTVVTPPPSSGGLTSLQMMALFDRLAQEKPAADKVEAFERLLEIAKVVWEERLTRLGDPQAMAVAPQELLTAGHLDTLLARVAKGLATPGPGRIVATDPLRGTVHLAAADSRGNVVSWTQTHGGGFGSGVMVRGTGIVLGHGMCRFDPRPGWTNSIAPRKRPLHNMCPVIALKDGQPVLAVGASGGRTIVNNCAGLTIGCLIQGLEPGDALAAPRLQCETIEPAVIESSAGEACIAALRGRGHTLTEVKRDAGSTHLIAREGDAWIGVAEPRAPIAAVAGLARH